MRTQDQRIFSVGEFPLGQGHDVGFQHVEQIDGINMYTWDWKDEALSSPMNYGVIAQEVAETHPEAVVTGEHGYMMVDYSKLGRAGEAALSRMEG